MELFENALQTGWIWKRWPFHFRVDGKQFDNGVYRKLCRGGWCVFKFVRRSVDGKYLMPFQSETFVFKFLRHLACEQAHLFGYREPAEPARRMRRLSIQTSEPIRRLSSIVWTGPIYHEAAKATSYFMSGTLIMHIFELFLVRFSPNLAFTHSRRPRCC